MRGEEVQLEGVPATFRTDRQQDTLVTAAERARDRGASARIGDEPNARRKQIVEVILNEDPELAVNGNLRQSGVTRLLQPFDQQRTIARRGQDVRVEVVALDAAGVRQDDLSDPECGKLCPQSAKHLWP